jgi:hypothetical protein
MIVTIREQHASTGRPHVDGPISRRQLLRTAFWSTAAGGTAGGTLTLGRYLWGSAKRPATQVHVARDLIPKPGADPVLFKTGGFWLVNLRPSEGRPTPLPWHRGPPQPVHPDAAASAKGGLLALVNRGTERPHNCRLVWRNVVDFLGLADAFSNPCSGSVYTKVGYPAFGPAPRPLDTLTIIPEHDGSVIVDTAAVQEGGLDNARRAVRP